MVELFVGIILPSHPVTKGTPPKNKRNAEIRARHRAGESLSTRMRSAGWKKGTLMV
jgi:hypothetical protein